MERGSARRAWGIGSLMLLIVGVLALPAPLQATVSGEEGMIAFVSNRDGNSEIYVMEADGSGQVNLTNRPGDQHSPTWSPDGQQIAYVHNRAAPSIWLMDADGGDRRFLVDGYDPSWSPDGKQIAFIAGGSVSEFNAEQGASLWVINVDGTGLQRRTYPESDPVYLELRNENPRARVYDAGPVWFPDGRSILFFRANEITYYVNSWSYSAHRLDLATGTLTSIGQERYGSWQSDISPDGASFVVYHDVNIDDGYLDEVDVATGQRRIIVQNLLGFGAEPDAEWSPTGSRLITAHSTEDLSVRAIATMSLEGEILDVLADSPGAIDQEPTWQPVNPYPMGLVDPSSGLWHLRAADGKVTSFYYGNPGDVPLMADWDCDGTATPGLFRQSDGYAYLRNSNTQGIADIRFFFGNPGDIPVAGDFNGDGCDTLSIYRAAEQRFYIINRLGSNDEGLGTADFSFVFGDPGDQPVVGDWDGDGIDTIGLHRASTGRFYNRDSNTQGVANNDYVFGDPGDLLVAADWNGDGDHSPAVFRPSNTTHYFRLTNMPGNANAQYIWGEATWVPVAPGR